MFRQKVRKVNHNEFVKRTGTFYKFGNQELIDILVADQFIVPVQIQVAGKW